MTTSIDTSKFKFSDEVSEAVRGKRVLVAGAGTDGGLGQALALAVGLNGAECVGLHFHRSYSPGLQTVELINALGGRAFAAQADLTNSSDAWSMRSHVIRQMDGHPPDVVLMTSEKAEKGYRLGRPPREVEGESAALRRARVRQAFVDNIGQSTTALGTKLSGFLTLTHLWAGEAQHFNQKIQMVYVSSRQAIDPGPGVPGYVLANFGVLWLPQVLEANLGSGSHLASAFSVLLPFVKTQMTAPYAERPEFWERWQPRLLETHEAAEALLRLLSQPRKREELIYQLNMEHPEQDEDLGGAESGPGPIRLTWSSVRLNPLVLTLPWSELSPILLDK